MRNINRLLIVTPLMEVVAGIVLLRRPSASMTLLLGPPLKVPAALRLSRSAEVALFGLGTSNWMAYYPTRRTAPREAQS